MKSGAGCAAQQHLAFPYISTIISANISAEPGKHMRNKYYGLSPSGSAPESLSWRDRGESSPSEAVGAAPMPWSPTNAWKSWCRVWELKSVPSGASRLPVWETKLSALWWTAQENWVSMEENPFVSFCKLGWASLWAVLSHNYKPLQCCRKTNLSNLHLWQRSRKDGRKHLNWLQFYPVQGPPWNWCH